MEITMNNNDIFNFNGSEIKIEDILKKPTKIILLGLYVETQDLKKSTKRVCGKIDAFDKKIDNQWAKISKNSTIIGYLKGILVFLIPATLGIIGYLAYTR